MVRLVYSRWVAEDWWARKANGTEEHVVKVGERRLLMGGYRE
jgi:hypothetical protein